MKDEKLNIYEGEINSALSIIDNIIERIEHDVRALITAFKNSPYKEYNELFNSLAEYQFLLAKLTFKWNITITPYLMKIVKEFDRIDDLEHRSYLTSAIQKGVYD